MQVQRQDGGTVGTIDSGMELHAILGTALSARLCPVFAVLLDWEYHLHHSPRQSLHCTLLDFVMPGGVGGTAIITAGADSKQPCTKQPWHVAIGYPH